MNFNLEMYLHQILMTKKNFMKKLNKKKNKIIILLKTIYKLIKVKQRLKEINWDIKMIKTKRKKKRNFKAKFKLNKNKIKKININKFKP